MPFAYFTHNLVLLLGGEPLLLDPGHVQDVGLGQSLLDAVKLLLRARQNTRSEKNIHEPTTFAIFFFFFF